MADAVKVQSLRWHTYGVDKAGNPIERPEGTIYEIDPDHPETLDALEATKMARRIGPDAPPTESVKKEPPAPAKKK